MGAEAEAAPSRAVALRWFARGLCLAQLDTGEHGLVAGTAPGETVAIEDVSTPWQRRFRATEVIEASPERVRPLCAFADTCPGCDLLHVRASAERDYKRLLLREVLERHAGVALDEAAIPILGAAARFNHRVRVSLHVGADRRLRLSAGAPEGPDLRSCPATAPALRRRLHRLMESELAPALAHVEAGLGEGDACWMRLRVDAGRLSREVLLRGLRSLALAWVEVRDVDGALRGVRGEVRGVGGVGGVGGEVRGEGGEVILCQGRFPAAAPVDGHGTTGHPEVWQHTAPGPARWLHRWVREQVHGSVHQSMHASAPQWERPPVERALRARELSVGREPGGQALRADVSDRRSAEGATTLLDATCGGGGLTTMLAPGMARVLAVDANWEAVRTCRRSADSLGLAHVETRGGKIETVAPRLLAAGESFDVVLINPMRRSLGEETMEALAALARRRLIYLAPAPMAGARDLAPLLQSGWSGTFAGADLHPGTGRVMLCAALSPP